jgi:hypothetical protein
MVTWEEFEFALASDDLIEKTNPGVRDTEIPPLSQFGLQEGHGVPRAVTVLLATLARPNFNEPITKLSVAAAAIVAVIVFALKNAMGHGGDIKGGFLFGLPVLLVGLIASGVVWFMRRDGAAGNEYYNHVMRFSRETGHDLDELIRYAEMSAYARAAGPLKAIKKEADAD